MLHMFPKLKTAGYCMKSSGAPAGTLSLPKCTSGLCLSMVGAVLVAVSGFAPWIDAFGVRLSGFRMAELTGGFGGRLPTMPPRWVGAAWYLLPIAAGVCWTLSFLRSPPRPTRAHLYVGAAVSASVALYMTLVGIHAGPSLALGGGLTMMFSGWSYPKLSTHSCRGGDRQAGSNAGPS